jgi:hypothetical protein
MDKKDPNRLVDFFLRNGLALAFLYAATAQFLKPEEWMFWFPQWLGNIVDLGILIHFFSAFEIGLALWLIADRKTLYAAIVSAATLAGIVVFNLQALDLIFRDVALLFMALALAALHWDGHGR